MPMNARLLRPRAAPSTGFDPRTIADLLAWYDFSVASTVAANSDGTGAVSNNGAISYVADRSGNGNHATNTGAAGTKPTYLTSAQNGLNLASWDGGDVLTASASNRTVAAQTVIVVGRMDTGVAGSARLISQGNSATDFINSGLTPLQRPGGGSPANDLISVEWTAGTPRANIGISLDTMFVASHVWSGTVISNAVNGGTPATGNFSGAAFTANRIALGHNAGNANNLTGRIAEVVWYTRALSAAELSTLVRYLGAKWGITVA
jgi:hypothetical protein